MGSRVAAPLPRVGHLAIVVAAVVVPVAFSRRFADPFMVVKATLLWVTAIVVVLASVVAVVRGDRPPLPSVWVVAPVATLVAWTVLSALLSDAVPTSFWGSHGRYDGVLTLVAVVAIAPGLVVHTWRDPRRLEPVAIAIGVSGAIGVGYVALEQLGWDGIDWQIQGSRGWLVGLGGNPNFSGAHLALVVPVVLAARLRASSRTARGALLAFALVLAVGVGWTQTRGGGVALVGGVAVASLLAPSLLPRPVRALACVATVVLLAGVALAGATEEVPGSDAFGSTSAFQAGGISQRTNIWAGATSMIAAHPLTGVGPDGFGRSLAEHRSSRGGRQLIAADEAHNVFLDRAATAGLPALAAHLALLGAVGTAAWRARRRLPDEHRWLLAAFGGMLGGYVLQGLFSIDTIPLALLGWLATGALVSLADPALIAARRSPPPPVPAPLPGGVVVAVGLIGLALIVGAARPAIADLHHQRGQDARRAGEPLVALGHDATAASWAGGEPRYRQALADDLVAAASAASVDPALRRTLLDEARIAYDQALDRSPGDARLRVGRAQVRVLSAAAASEVDAALDHLDAAASTYGSLLDDLDATDDLHLGYGRVLEARAVLEDVAAARSSRSAAAAQYEQARGYQPHRLDATLALARVRAAQGRPDTALELLDEAEELGGDLKAIQEARRDVARQQGGGEG